MTVEFGITSILFCWSWNIINISELLKVIFTKAFHKDRKDWSNISEALFTSYYLILHNCCRNLYPGLSSLLLGFEDGHQIASRLKSLSYQIKRDNDSKVKGLVDTMLLRSVLFQFLRDPSSKFQNLRLTLIVESHLTINRNVKWEKIQ